ncbi:MAG TPA: hypothetical protein VIS06_00155 [Mycobacteriales bacterium]|jgi:hypothetical protein
MSSADRGVRELLVPRPRENYLRSPLPAPRDQRIGALVDQLESPDDFARVAAGIADLAETVLDVYAQRMAVLAVRRTAAEPLRQGLRAACLANSVDDPRNVIVVLGLLWRSAELIGLSPAEEFTAVARRTGTHGNVLRAFTGRPPESRSIAAMKYAERGAGEDFEYVCLW